MSTCISLNRNLHLVKREFSSSLLRGGGGGGAGAKNHFVVLSLYDPPVSYPELGTCATTVAPI